LPKICQKFLTILQTLARYDHEGNPTYEYWDRDGGTRPFTNVRRHLTQGWRQLKFAGSTMILAPDGTFCCNDDPTATDPSTWGKDVKDTGEVRTRGSFVCFRVKCLVR
jgi:predicted amidohydrolase